VPTTHRPESPTRSNHSVRASRTAGPTHSRRVSGDGGAPDETDRPDAEVVGLLERPAPSGIDEVTDAPHRRGGWRSEQSRGRRLAEESREANHASSGAPGLLERSRGSGPRPTPPGGPPHRGHASAGRCISAARARQNEGSPEHGGPWVDPSGRVRQPAGCSNRPARLRRSGGERSPRPGSPSRTRVLPSTRPWVDGAGGCSQPAARARPAPRDSVRSGDERSPRPGTPRDQVSQRKSCPSTVRSGRGRMAGLPGSAAVARSDVRATTITEENTSDHDSVTYDIPTNTLCLVVADTSGHASCPRPRRCRCWPRRGGCARVAAGDQAAGTGPRSRIAACAAPADGRGRRGGALPEPKANRRCLALRSGTFDRASELCGRPESAVVRRGLGRRRASAPRDRPARTGPRSLIDACAARARAA
jgi:hypothetical protein